LGNYLKTFKTSAISLGSFNYGESNRIVNFITPEHGLLKAVAHGARKMSSRFGAGIEAATLSSIILYKSKSDLLTLREIVINNAYTNLKNSLEKLQAVLKLLGHLKKTFHSGLPEQELFSQIVDFLNYFDSGYIDEKDFSMYSDVIYLHTSGVFPDWGKCNSCEIETGKFYLSSEGMVCHTCAQRLTETPVQVSPDVRNIFRRIGEKGFFAFNGLKISQNQYMDIDTLLQKLLYSDDRKNKKTMG